MTKMRYFGSLGNLRNLPLIFVISVVTGCGGGGGSPGATGASAVAGATSTTAPSTPSSMAPPSLTSPPDSTPTSAVKLVLTVEGSVANQVTTVLPTRPATLSVLLTAGGAGVPQTMVNFTPTIPVLVQFVPSGGFVMTDSSGAGTTQVLPGNATSAGPVSITATVMYNGATVTSNIVQLAIAQQ